MESKRNLTISNGFIFPFTFQVNSDENITTFRGIEKIVVERIEEKIDQHFIIIIKSRW